MILNCFFHQTLNHYFSYIRSKEKNFPKIWPLKVYSNLNDSNDIKGPGLWKMNCSLLDDEDYVNDITEKIPIWLQAIEYT